MNPVTKLARFLAYLPLVATLFLMSACGVTGSQVVKGGVVTVAQLVSCEPSEQDAVQNAIANGGANWISVVLDSIGCVYKVYEGLKGAGLLADNGDTLPLSHRAQRRLTTSLMLYKLIVK